MHDQGRPAHRHRSIDKSKSSPKLLTERAIAAPGALNANHVEAEAEIIGRGSWASRKVSVFDEQGPDAAPTSGSRRVYEIGGCTFSAR
jgi:hypothetical protein